MKKELPAEKIPEEVHLKANLMAKALFNTKPITNKKLKKKYGK